MQDKPTQADATKLFAGQATCLLAAADAVQFPATRLPEIALIGRSNVGKSSLVNALTGRKALARASKTPGRTQQIVFFDVGQKLMLADLPGYGHAKAPRDVQDQWNNLVHTYLRTRPPLRCVCLLIDGRHGILANDLGMMQFLDRAAVSYQIVLTKLDLVKPLERDARVQQTTALIQRHAAARPGVMAVSSEKNLGMDELRLFLATIAAGKL
ncbi:MAG: YihA family ribosome biogenesis GTP-binding protein [Alphaproteobacteria bacterium]|nr:YihA family ribosome biogenesis GTP-binding protein [Alphaproteobacteria bacterium]MBV8549390.1 YihA family ribosome biogenesis GTP-binding protein [Alphaproteobacteria bacterium]